MLFSVRNVPDLSGTSSENSVSSIKPADCHVLENIYEAICFFCFDDWERRGNVRPVCIKTAEAAATIRLVSDPQTEAVRPFDLTTSDFRALLSRSRVRVPDPMRAA